MLRVASRLAIALLLSVASVAAAPAGPPAAPAAGPAPDIRLKAHTLAPAPSPLDNPLKGFIPFHFPGKTYAGKFPHSMQWSYFALKDLMPGENRFDWAPLEKVLAEVTASGRQLCFRVYLEYPSKASGVPDFLVKSGVRLRKNDRWGTDSPDYDDPRTVRALTSFIEAFGKRYDGDPRIGFIHMGLVGLWGEWHTWPADNLAPKPATMKKIIDAYDAAFDRTKLEIRYFNLADGYAVGKNIGFHDDSMFFRGDGKGNTLPESMGGWNWSFLQQAVEQGGENRWIAQSVGGETRPEIQRLLAKGKGKLVDDPLAVVELSHVSWQINQNGIGIYKAADPEMGKLVRRMGYDLRVTSAHFNDIAEGESLRVGVSIENNGVAPFYQPWRPVVAVLDQKDQIAGIWYANWDLREVMPREIRAFPDWKLAGNPQYVPFGKPRYFAFEQPQPKLGPGRYRLVMRVVNPLERVLEKRRAKGEAVARAVPLRFGNETQRSNGWLVLGEFEVAARK
jgi:hypothetical protein